MVALLKFQKDLEGKIAHLQQLVDDVFEKKDSLERGFLECETKLSKEVEEKVNERRGELKMHAIAQLREAAEKLGYIKT